MYMHMISMISHIVCEFWYNIYIINIPLGSPIFFGPIAAIQVGWRVWCAIHSVSSSGHHENHGFRWLTSMFECFSSIKLWFSMVFHIFLWSSLTFFFNSEAGKKSPGHFLWFFFRSSASEFIELFVGVGASRVRDIFKQAKEKAQGAWMGQHLEISVTFL